MTPLRQKMINDMKLRRFAIGTQKLYVYAVEDLSKYYNRSPDLISEEEAHGYLLYLQEERKLEWGSCNCMAAGLNFFYKTTLKEKNIRFKIPKRKHTKKLPTILSRSELIKLFFTIATFCCAVSGPGIVRTNAFLCSLTPSGPLRYFLICLDGPIPGYRHKAVVSALLSHCS